MAALIMRLKMFLVLMLFVTIALIPLQEVARQIAPDRQLWEGLVEKDKRSLIYIFAIVFLIGRYINLCM